MTILVVGIGNCLIHLAIAREDGCFEVQIKVEMQKATVSHNEESLSL
jgi:hypothetical protein